MSGIFDLFNGTSNSGTKNFSLGSTEIARKSASSMNVGNVAGVAGKNVNLSRPKPKGLSIRSKSDLNVNGGRSPFKKSPVKVQLLKTEFAPSKSRLQLSPCRDTKYSKLKASSSKSRSPDKVIAVEEAREINIFRKPLTPAKTNGKATEMYPEPDKLAHYCDEEKDFYPETESLDEQFVKLMRESMSRVKPYQDEGFESDPEFVTVPNIEPIIASFEEEVKIQARTLPSLSDDDDFDEFLE